MNRDREMVLIALRYMLRETQAGRPLAGESVYTVEEILLVAARFRELPEFELADVWRRTLEFIHTPEPAASRNDAWLTFREMRTRLRAINGIAALALRGVPSYPTE